MRFLALIFTDNISIHALREEGDPCPVRHDTRTNISIHALREEGDADYRYRTNMVTSISIHALREEGDAAQAPARAEA